MRTARVEVFRVNGISSRGNVATTQPKKTQVLAVVMSTKGESPTTTGRAERMRKTQDGTDDRRKMMLEFRKRVRIIISLEFSFSTSLNLGLWF